MPYIYSDAASLAAPPTDHRAKNVGTGQCVALIEAYTSAPKPAAVFWTEGIQVRGNDAIKIGTAIATFVGGKYQSHQHGNHAAFYISQDSTGLWVVDQFIGSHGIHKRHLAFQGKNPDGSYKNPSNNGDAFSVIE